MLESSLLTQVQVARNLSHIDIKLENISTVSNLDYSKCFHRMAMWVPHGSDTFIGIYTLQKVYFMRYWPNTKIPGFQAVR